MLDTGVMYFCQKFGVAQIFTGEDYDFVVSNDFSEYKGIFRSFVFHKK